MNPLHLIDLARSARLYPGVILHGSHDQQRIQLAFEVARTLLCSEAALSRPCGTCRNCSRILPPELAEGRFHPDVLLVERDLRTSTSVEAIRGMLRTAQVSPFEARGQVFIVRTADSMSPAGANALLKNLEEPALSAPRHFLLLTPSPSDLLPTLRSRCLSVYLGATIEPELQGDRALVLAQLELAINECRGPGRGVFLLIAAQILEQAWNWSDMRSGEPMMGCASLLLDLAKRSTEAAKRRQILDLAYSVMDAKDLRLRSISPRRILEAKLADCLTPLSLARA